MPATGGTPGTGGAPATGGAGGQGMTCTNMCTNGVTQCQSGSTLQTCTVVGGCTTFTTSACGSSTVCERYAPAACADPEWAEWPAPNSATDVAAGAPNPEGYTINGDGTVTDKVTGLMWQQTLSTQKLAWSAAVAACPTLTLGGYGDWRLPTGIELLSLVDYSAPGAGPYINTTAFPGTPSGVFWSSTPTATDSTKARSVGFDTGGSGDQDNTQVDNVRCVR
jgi:hypothetical protein